MTKGDFWVRGVQHAEIDEKGKGYIIFSANGMNYKNMSVVKSSFDAPIPEEDPYHIHYYRIDLNGKNLVCLTPERGIHSITLNSDHSVAFTNTRNGIIPTGIIMTIAPFAIGICVFGAVFIFIICRKKRRSY